jgi:hypothetical protein
MSQVLVDYSRDTYTDDALITEVQSIETHLSPNSSFPTPSPTVAAIIAERELFQAAVAKAKDGTPTDTSDKNDKRAVIEGMMHVLGANVQLTSGGDETKILSTGMHTAASKARIGVFAVVNNFKVITQEASNKVLCSCDTMPKAGFYEVLYTASPATATSVWISETSTSHSIEIEDLPSFVPYVFKMAARGSDRRRNYCAPITRAAN